jgi:hypothetical protein
MTVDRMAMSTEGVWAIGRVDAATNKAQGFAGPNPKILEQNIMIKSADGTYHFMPMFIACRPDGDCKAFALDGEGYSDLQEFVDDSKLIEPGDQVIGPTDLTSPGSPQRHLETFTKRVIPPRVWYAGGGALLVLLVVVALWRQARTRRRRADE